MSFDNIDEIRETVEQNDGHFFSDGAMRFFNSRIETGVIGGCYFITSEQRDPTPSELRRGAEPNDLRYSRLYTVRRAHQDGTIETVGEFQSYETLDAAREAIENM